MDLCNLDAAGAKVADIVSSIKAVFEDIASKGVLDLKSQHWTQIRSALKDRLIHDYQIVNGYLRDVLELEPRFSAKDLFEQLLSPLTMITNVAGDEAGGIRFEVSERPILEDLLEHHDTPIKPIGTDEKPDLRNLNEDILAIYSWPYSAQLSHLFIEALKRVHLGTIRKCLICGDIYLAKRVRPNQKYCSEKCKRAKRYPKEKWAEYMRQRRREKRRKFAARLIQALEPEILRTMKSSGYTREEVIAMFKADGRVPDDA